MSDVNVVGMPEFNELLDHIYEYGTVAEGVVERANAFARAVIARYTPPEGYVLISEEVLRVWGKLDEVRECCRYPKHAASQPATPTTDYQEPAMTTETDLLPLPKWMSNYTIPTDGFEYGEGVMLDDCMRDYARANVLHHTATLQAEVERLNRILIRLGWTPPNKHAQQSAAPDEGQTTGITATELGYALKRATPAQVIEYLEDDVDMHVALSIYFEEQHNQQPAAVAVDEAMVERACRHWYSWWDEADQATKMLWAEKMYDLLAAALAAQHQEPTT